MSEPTGDIEALVGGVRELCDAQDRYLGHLRIYLGMGRSELYALRLIAKRCADERPISPTQLARELGLSNAAATALLDRLEVAGHITRELVASDRRRRDVRITPGSALLASDMFGPLEGSFAAALRRFSDADLAAAQAVLDALVRAAKDAGSEVGAPDFVLLEQHPGLSA